MRAWFAGGPRPSVMKADATWGGSGVRMVESEKEALAAYGTLRRRGGLGAVVKRLMVNRDPLATWTLRKQQRADLTLQERIAGRPSNAMVAAWRGEVLAIVAVEVLSSQGPTGAGIVVRVVDNREITRAARLLTERLGMSGFFGLDFVIDAGSGTPHLIELNPRCTQLGHLAILNKGDLAGLLYAKLAGKPCSRSARPDRKRRHRLLSPGSAGRPAEPFRRRGARGHSLGAPAARAGAPLAALAGAAVAVAPLPPGPAAAAPADGRLRRSDGAARRRARRLNQTVPPARCLERRRAVNLAPQTNRVTGPN